MTRGSHDEGGGKGGPQRRAESRAGTAEGKTKKKNATARRSTAAKAWGMRAMKQRTKSRPTTAATTTTTTTTAVDEATTKTTLQR